MNQSFIFDRIKDYNNLTDAQLNIRINDIKPYMQRLWTSYRTQQINVDYSENLLQEAYILRYYVLYYKVAYDFLQAVLEEFFLNFHTSNKLKILFIGAGPAPEIIATLQYFMDLDISNFGIRSIKIIDLDKYGKKWKYSRKLISYNRYKEMKALAESINIRWIAAHASFNPQRKYYNLADQGDSNKFDIIYSQNFFNEIVGNIDRHVFINFLNNNLNSNGVFLSSDRSGYPAVNHFFNSSVEESNGLLDSLYYKGENHTADYEDDNNLLRLLFDGSTGLRMTRNARSDQRVIRKV